jgi:hypothetical protein
MLRRKHSKRLLILSLTFRDIANAGWSDFMDSTVTGAAPEIPGQQ